MILQALVRQAAPLLLAIALLLGTADPARAWDGYGHELSGAIAYAELRPEVRERVNTLLRQHPQHEWLSLKCPKGMDMDLYVFMKAATWPDAVRSTANPLHETDHHAAWHYINFPVELGGITGPAPKPQWAAGSDPENILQALARADADLKSPAMTEPDKAKALCWLEHLVGDLHQPLHAVALFSPQFPKGDKGGNSFFVSVDGRTTNLHSLWDRSLGTTSDSAAVAARARKLCSEPKLTRAALASKLARGKDLDWAKESAELARTEAYQDGRLKGAKASKGGRGEQPGEPVPALPQDYRRRAGELAEERIVLAGYRLADRLNGLLETAPKR